MESGLFPIPVCGIVVRFPILGFTVVPHYANDVCFYFTTGYRYHWKRTILPFISISVDMKCCWRIDRLHRALSHTHVSGRFRRSYRYSSIWNVGCQFFPNGFTRNAPKARGRMPFISISIDMKHYWSPAMFFAWRSAIRILCAGRPDGWSLNNFISILIDMKCRLSLLFAMMWRLGKWAGARTVHIDTHRYEM